MSCDQCGKSRHGSHQPSFGDTKTSETDRGRSEFEHQYQGHSILIFNHETIMFDQSVLESILTNTAKVTVVQEE